MTPNDRNNFDLVIGRLDRALSEFLCLYSDNLDEPDRQTLKHHADDLVGVGNKMHSVLNIIMCPVFDGGNADG